MDSVSIVALVLVGLFVAYKLGFFTIGRNMADVAVDASSRYKEEAWVEGIQSSRELEISTEEIQDAMANRAIISSLMEQDLRGKLRPRPAAKPAKDA